MPRILPLRERMRRAGLTDPLVLKQWLALPHRVVVEKSGPDLVQVGLGPDDAALLLRTLPDEAMLDIGNLLMAGRMADLDMRWVHWWAASGLIEVAWETDKRGRNVKHATMYARWATKARKFIAVMDGDQEVAALGAACGFTPGELKDGFDSDGLTVEKLRVLAALQHNMAF